MGLRRMTGWGFNGELLPEKVFDFLGQGVVEVVRDGELAFRGAKLKPLRFFFVVAGIGTSFATGSPLSVMITSSPMAMRLSMSEN
jgi:hypothetical protein